MLGKLLTQVMIELKEGKEFGIDEHYLRQSNNEFVDYN